LAFRDLAPERLEPWVELEPNSARTDQVNAETRAARLLQLAEQRRAALAEWGIGEPELRSYTESTQVRVLTPGSTAGEPVHMLSSLERRSKRWDTDA
jgi:hypothetical protein